MKTILEIIEEEDWEVTISVGENPPAKKQSLVIEGDSHSFKMLAGILLDMARVVEEMPPKKQRGYGVLLAPEETSQLIMPHSNSLTLECTPLKKTKN
ncbi:hypothetical protein MNBD_PLANCTO02-1910 [hydrothermal vent metagenome]|uniref:Uncharacterized protein n=1 Tax=hydrothermal vent metagenome TaxID=652676 RepID=A0A3B1DX30_9ZZZZ